MIPNTQPAADSTVTASSSAAPADQRNVTSSQREHSANANKVCNLRNQLTKTKMELDAKDAENINLKVSLRQIEWR